MEFTCREDQWLFFKTVARKEWAPQHVFLNLFDIMPAGCEKRWKAELKDRRDRITTSIQSGSAHPDSRQALIETSGRDFVATKIAEMRLWTEMPTSQWCVKHGRCCELCPRVGDKLHMEVAGSTCVAFSSMGARWGWLHESSITFLAWGRRVRAMRPHCVVHECVPKFPEDMLATVLNCEGQQYAVSSFVFSPVQQGVPINRKRRYSVAILLPQLRLVREIFGPDDFADLTFCSCALAADCFLRASEEEIARIKQEMVRAANLPPDCQGRPWHFRAVLPSGDFQRLQQVLQQGFLDDPGCGLVSLSQNATFQRRNAATAPALLKSSSLYRVIDKRSRQDRPVMPTEYYCMQMLPLHLPPGHTACQLFGEEELRNAGVLTSMSKTRALMGNGMNMHSVGAIVVYVLSSFEKNIRATAVLA